MPRHVAIQQGRLYPQPDYSLSVDREGKWTATQVYFCHRNSITQLMPRPGTAHQDVPFITLDHAVAEVSEGDLATITCHYAGTENTNDNPDQTTYTLGLSLSEEPILSHENYKDLESEELAALQAILSGKDRDEAGITYKDKVASAPGREVLEKIQRGQTSYYSPRVVWRQSTVRKTSAAASDLAKIGRIDSPDGREPSLPGSANWLLNGVTQAHEGSAYRIEREWIASDRGGWDPDIYD